MAIFSLFSGKSVIPRPSTRLLDRKPATPMYRVSILGCEAVSTLRGRSVGMLPPQGGPTAIGDSRMSIDS